MVAKSEELSTDDPYEQIICFMEHASNVVTRMIHRNSGTHVIHVTIDTHLYHSLCDIGASVSAIPFAL